jgi:error-prone DNA polymerase
VKNFAHLHVHSCFSFQDGASGVEKLVRKAGELGMDAMAITDHNNLSAAVRFTKAAKECGIKPICGAEVTLEDGSHLVLLAENPKGYSNISKILTEAYMSRDWQNTAQALEGKDVAKTREELKRRRLQPKVYLASLEEHNEGIIALSGCMRGAIPILIRSGRFGCALRLARKYAGIFGPDRFYIELENLCVPGNAWLLSRLVELADEVGVGVCATNNVHYIKKEDFMIHDVLTCIRTLTKLDDVHPERRSNAENYLKSPEEMEALFRLWPEAVRTAGEIAARCEPGLLPGRNLFPEFPLPSGTNSAEHLRRLVYKGAETRYGNVTPEIKSRLEHELNIICTLGYEDYFQVAWDIVMFAKGEGIRFAGRGSAADSAVAYCLFITNVDPIRRGLIFERFLSLERAQKPDIDIDFDARRRDEVKRYVRHKYGTEHVATVCTFNTFKARSAVRDVGKVLGISGSDLDRLAKRLPHIYADEIEIAIKKYPELYSGDISFDEYLRLFEVCHALAGLPRHIGTHLGGLVVSRIPLAEVSPLQVSAGGDVIVQFDKDDVEEIGLIKLDLLSLRMLSAVEDSVASSRVDPEKIPLDDDATYKMVNKGETIGVFQLESPAQRALQGRLGASDIEDIVASIALIRPGPIQGNMVEPFIARRKGQEDVTYIHPALEKILGKTYGVVLYQEQVIEIASAIAGFTPGEADRLRKVMTHHRSRAEMDEIGKEFVKKAVKNGVAKDVAETILSYIVGYAGYGFCQAHAAAFADTSYKTALGPPRYHSDGCPERNRFSISMILFTRRRCLPPANCVSSHTFTISLATPLPITLSPKASILALLCSRLFLAVNVSWHTAHLAPGTLFAAIHEPTPAPSTIIPRSNKPRATAWATRKAKSG